MRFEFRYLALSSSGCLQLKSKSRFRGKYNIGFSGEGCTACARTRADTGADRRAFTATRQAHQSAHQVRRRRRRATAVRLPLPCG